MAIQGSFLTSDEKLRTLDETKDQIPSTQTKTNKGIDIVIAIDVSSTGNCQVGFHHVLVMHVILAYQL